MYEDFYTRTEDVGGAGLLSKRHRADDKIELGLSVLTIGRNVAFGGGKGGGGSSPDPQIGAAALKQAETGQQWLDFAKDQFAIGNTRQESVDKLANEVSKLQLNAQKQSNQWAAEDRGVSTQLRDKYEQWADEDRALGRQTKAELDAYAKESIATGNRYGDQFDGVTKDQYGFAKEQQGRYRDTFQPIEDKLASDAMGWDSDARLASEAAKAKADVVGNAASQRAASQRSMASMGIDPRSGRYAGVERATDLQTALASAGAQNAARDTVRMQAQDMRNNAANIGQRVNANANTATGLGMQAAQSGHTARNTGMNTAMQAKNLGLAAAGVGNSSAQLGLGNQGAGYAGINTGLSAGSAANNSLAGANQQWANNNAIMGQGFGGAMQGYAGQASTLNQSWSNQIAQQQANNASAGGLMSGIGSIAGAGITAYF